MWQPGLSFAAWSTTGVSVLEPIIMGSALSKEDKTNYLSKTLQVFRKSMAGERRTTSWDFSVLWDILALNRPLNRSSGYRSKRRDGEEEKLHTDKIKKPTERTWSITRHRNQNLGMSSNFLRRGKPCKFFPGESEGGVKWKCLFNQICPWRNPSFSHTWKNDLKRCERHISPQHLQTQPLPPAWGEMPEKYKTTHFFLFLITNYFREALMALFELSQSSEAETAMEI